MLITTWDILDGFNVTTHHQNSSLDGLLSHIFLLSEDEVRSHNSGLHTSGNFAREDTTESIETSLVRGGYHLGDVHHQWSVGVASLSQQINLVSSGFLGST